MESAQKQEEPDSQPEAEAPPGAKSPEATKQAQEEIERQRKLIEDSENMMNKLREEIAEQMPFISEKKETVSLLDEWQDNKFYASVQDLIQRYQFVRRLRRDGNCFYRALLFQLFEHSVAQVAAGNKGEYNRMREVIEKSKGELMEIGYDEIAIEDFYDTFID